MIINGDCVAVMAGMEERSVDAIVTDPPYGLEFMGKGWDKLAGRSAEEGRKIHEWHYQWARQALRLLKPGGHLVSFGGTRTYHRLACAVEDARFEIRDCLCWLYGSGFPKSENLSGGHKGWGTALKPAFEPILLARRPVRGTVEKNALVYGTGALNVDGCRIGDDSRFLGPAGNDGRSVASVAPVNITGYAGHTVTGRWPANVLLDEVAASMLDEQTGDLGVSAGGSRGAPGMWSGLGAVDAPQGFGDSGGASRFFYCAKASRAERNAGLEDFEKGLAHDDVRLNTATDRSVQRSTQQNVHPTVKPIELMRWLCRLVTPAGGTILDPFLGSGTTGIAAGLEGFEFLGIERDPDYVALAEARIAHWTS